MSVGYRGFFSLVSSCWRGIQEGQQEKSIRTIATNEGVVTPRTSP